MKIMMGGRNSMDNRAINDRVDMAQLLIDVGFADVDVEAEEQLLYCVFHNDSGTRSFSVNLKKKVFHCFSSACAVRGSSIKLYALWKGISFEQAREEIQFLPRRRDVAQIQQQLSQMKTPASMIKRLETITEFTKAMPLLVDTPHATSLTSRGLSLETLRKFDCRFYSPEIAAKMDSEKLYAAGIANVWKKPVYTNHPILFPFYAGNSVAFLQGRLLDSDPVRSKYLGCRGTIPCLFNHNSLASRPDRVFITEGVIDAMSLDQMGYSPALGVVGTEGFKPDWAEEFKGVSEVWLAVDNDPAGDAAAASLAQVLQAPGRKVFRLAFDRQYKDINEVLVKVGRLSQ